MNGDGNVQKLPQETFLNLFGIVLIFKIKQFYCIVNRCLGDTIQFIRYAPLVAEFGGKVIVECQEPLVRLISTVPGIHKIVALGETLPQFDVHAPLLSLPYILGTTLETIPVSNSYLKALESVKIKLDSLAKLNVGIVWSGNPENPDNQKRSCSLKDFLDILDIPDLNFYSLQKGIASHELNDIPDSITVNDISSQLQDFADTAAVVEQLDLIITVDTSVAHLAGALGKQVWLLLCYNPDWRWLLNREDSPWYPTMRLFRQPNPGNWSAVFTRVHNTLLDLIQ